MSAHKFALEAIRLGISVIPIKADGSKCSTLISWGKYNDERATEDTVNAWFIEHINAGVAIVCGEVSGQLECLDFDEREAFDAWRELMVAAGYTDLVRELEDGYLEHSPNGVHIFYRCSTIAGATKLASNDAHCIIETRGRGSYLITAPSCGKVHPSGKPYTIVSGGLATIATISPEQRKCIHDTARTLDERSQSKGVYDFEKENGGGPRSDEERPGDDFVQHNSWRDILEPHGWRRLNTRADVTYWRRPGKDKGVSATTNYAGAGYLHVFTTSSSAFDGGRSYGKFSAHARLEYGGDFSACSRGLREGGYGGERKKPSAGVDISELWGQAKVESPALDQVDLSGLLGPSAKVKDKPNPEAKPTTMLSNGGTYNELSLNLDEHVPPATYLLRDTSTDHGGSIEVGTVTMMAAEGGAGKTSLLLQLAMAVGSGNAWMERYEVLMPGKVVCLFAEEDMRRLRDRLAKTASVLNLSANDKAHFHHNVFLWSGANCPSPAFFVLDGRTIVPTAFFKELVELVMERKPRLLIVDPLASFASLTETDSESAAQCMGYFRGLAKEHGVAIYLAHHTRKPAAGAEASQHDARGSSAITNAIREQHGLTKLENGTGCTFEVVKFNNGRWGPSTKLPLVFDELHGYAPRPQDEHDLLEIEHMKEIGQANREERVEKAKEEKHTTARDRARERIVAEVAKLPGRSKTAVRDAVQGSTRIVRAELEALIVEGEFDVVAGARKSQLLYPKGAAPAGSNVQ